MNSRDLVVVPVMQAGPPRGQAGPPGPRPWVAPWVAAVAAAAAFALLNLFGGAADFPPPPPGAVEATAAAETASRRDAAVMFVRIVRIAGIAMLVVSTAWFMLTGLRRHVGVKLTGIASGMLLTAFLPSLMRMLYGLPAPPPSPPWWCCMSSP